MSEFRVGERYRLGFVQQKGEYVRDDWTGVEVELLGRQTGTFEGGLWRAKRSGAETLVVSEERLRASARLGESV